MKKHLYGSVGIVCGDCYSLCGTFIGCISPADGTIRRLKNWAKSFRTATCKNCRKIKIKICGKDGSCIEGEYSPTAITGNRRSNIFIKPN